MPNIDFESSAVQSYLSILQGVISRMATNSAAAKTWCVGLVSAIVVLLYDNGAPEYVPIALIPLSLFAFLDAFYLGLERRFRDQYNAFIKKVHDDSASVEDLYIVSPGKGFWVSLMSVLGALTSASVWPFYGLLMLMLFLLTKLG